MAGFVVIAITEFTLMQAGAESVFVVSPAILCLSI